MSIIDLSQSCANACAENFPPILYCQCEAIPDPANLSISVVLIWISIIIPFGHTKPYVDFDNHLILVKLYSL